MKQLYLIVLLMLVSMTATMGQDITGEWNGTLSVQNTSLRLVFHIDKTEDGYSATMDSPDQGAKGLKMSHVTFKDSLLTIELRIAGMSYTGKPENNTLVGTFKQAGQSFPLVLTKNLQAVTATEMPTVDKNANYVEIPKVLETKTGRICGTLTEPKGFKKGQVVLIIAGSGPTDRDGNNPSMTCDTYKKIAHELAKNNIASLRYDKRGIAESVASVERESDLVFDNYVQDAAAWIMLLKADKRFKNVVVIGHSEGSLIGMCAAYQAKADKYISVAGIGRPASDLLKEQLEAQGAEVKRLAFPLIDSLAQGMSVNVVDPTMQSIFRTSVQPYLISWFKYDPLASIKQLKVPVLLIQGTNDIQVPVEDAKRLSAAKPSAKLMLIDRMNHVLRISESEREANLATYNNPELPLADGLMDAIIAFIKK